MDATTTKKRTGVAKSLKKARQLAAPSGWKRTVKVWAIGNNPIQWYLDSSLKDPATDCLVFDKDRDQMPKKDHYLVDFKLMDFSGLNLRFKPSPPDAFAVKIFTRALQPPFPCPPKGGRSISIYPISCDPNGNSLTIRNDDMNVEYFSFALYFDSDIGEQRYDPGGENQNGGYSFD